VLVNPSSQVQSSLIAFFALALRYTLAQPKAASPFDEQVEDQATFEGLQGR
jgi:hypothetical protein